MTDVRALLQSERASRRLAHPDLSYTKSGLLNCNICALLIKSESLWERHLRSPIHKTNLQARSNIVVEGLVSKKRKIDNDDEDTRKKNKAEEPMADGPDEEGRKARITNPAIRFSVTDRQEDDAETGKKVAEIVQDASLVANGSEQRIQNMGPPAAVNPPAIDEDEWAAFEREVVPLTYERPPPAGYASATIFAAPMSAAEIAVQRAAGQVPSWEKEAEDEKEEEERRMEEEFEVMEEMEEKVRRLKERREALRKELPQTLAINGSVREKLLEHNGVHVNSLELRRDDGANGEVEEEEEEEEDDDDDSDYDDWGFS